MPLNVLVTGGAGYVGSTLSHLLLDRGHGVTVIDNLSFGGEALLGLRHHPGFTFQHGDITDDGLLETLFAEDAFDAVVHLAAIVGDPACAKQPDLAAKVNGTASVKLLAAARRHGVLRFIFASTCSNYGRMADGESYVDETSPLAPISLYAELKVAFEQRLIATNLANDRFCPTAIRCATVHGLSPRMRFDLTVSEF
ncbi:MAG: NAD-dependent epimerase/dehydratase family protein, partial [Alphaproteobacteria bacterium]